ncbi:hypothetical protein CROQUDRAFT_666249 [Cronartium quercuum f. sp. fusiforme G11]|uniref:WD40 repeat-like protein n=1 Tax=Cronartium quercuum f. sp. fusiforme G11 TaxID=708437 RepID=A0A9P6T592_9BASI|nr:hypothetical protein CROQUDRAFT_666249 [Cronartium quercuum f. sp. fusiforme G11]
MAQSQPSNSTSNQSRTPIRRVSYLIPLLSNNTTITTPTLQIPPPGLARNPTRISNPRPLIIPIESKIPIINQNQLIKQDNLLPRHSLGINAFAIDLSTHIQDREGPQGILYTGAKDGLIAAWELGLPTKLRANQFINHDVIYENQYEIDHDQLSKIKIPQTTLRQCVQSHTDWCNDILLCNHNQTLISASSDRTLKAWSPHSPEQSCSPTTIGSHNDYVKCLAYSRLSGWVASGGLDRKIKLWDLKEGRDHSIAEESLESSIYSLATISEGTILAAGSPSKAIKIYDPRSSMIEQFKLVGHTDNVRSILISNDGTQLLSGSSDSSIKLWDLRLQRCLQTFTHHSSPVWSISSLHPRLEIFHSGDRAGYVCKVDLETQGIEGECVVLCKVDSDDEQVNIFETMGNENVVRIVSVDDTFVWTASGSSSVKRWKDVPTRAQRRKTHLKLNESTESQPTTTKVVEPSNSRTSPSTPAPRPRQIIEEIYPQPKITEDSIDGLPLDSLVPLISPNNPIGPPPLVSYSHHDSHQPLESTLSLSRYPTLTTTEDHSRPTFSQRHSSTSPEPIKTNQNQAWQLFRLRDSSADAIPLREAPDSIIEGRAGLIKCELLNDRRHVISIDTIGTLALWDIVSCVCKGIFTTEGLRASTASTISSESSGSDPSPKALVASDLVALVKDRIEGNASVSNWCTVETQTGLLTVHLDEQKVFDAEVYADESGLEIEDLKDDSRICLGKWVLRNLFDGFVAYQQARRLEDVPAQYRPRSSSEPFVGAAINVQQQQQQPPRTPGMTISLARAAATATLPPAIPDQSHRSRAGMRPQTEAFEAGLPMLAETDEQNLFKASNPNSSQSSLSPQLNTNEDPPAGTSSSSTTILGRLRALSRNHSKLNRRPELPLHPPPLPRAQSHHVTSSTTSNNDELQRKQRYQATLLQSILSRPFTPCPPTEAPKLDIPLSTAILISEESDSSGAWEVTYRGLVSTTEEDAVALEAVAPGWLLEFLYGNRTIGKEGAKVTFVLLPMVEEEEEKDRLKELPNGNARLTASKVLRIRKVFIYVTQKLEIQMNQNQKSEEIIELFCNGTSLDWNMSLGAVKQFIWRKGGDVEILYRWRRKEIEMGAKEGMLYF